MTAPPAPGCTRRLRSLTGGSSGSCAGPPPLGWARGEGRSSGIAPPRALAMARASSGCSAQGALRGPSHAALEVARCGRAALDTWPGLVWRAAGLLIVLGLFATAPTLRPRRNWIPPRGGVPARRAGVVRERLGPSAAAMSRGLCRRWRGRVHVLGAGLWSAPRPLALLLGGQPRGRRAACAFGAGGTPLLPRALVAVFPLVRCGKRDRAVRGEHRGPRRDAYGRLSWRSAPSRPDTAWPRERGVRLPACPTERRRRHRVSAPGAFVRAGTASPSCCSRWPRRDTFDAAARQAIGLAVACGFARCPAGHASRREARATGRSSVAASACWPCRFRTPPGAARASGRPRPRRGWRGVGLPPLRSRYPPLPAAPRDVHAIDRGA